MQKSPSRTRSHYFLATMYLAALGALTFSFSSAAQPARWYKVELIVFKQYQGESSETWEAVPALAYPSKARFLVDPSRVAAVERDTGMAARVDNIGQIHLSDYSDTETAGSGINAERATDSGPYTVLSSEARDLNEEAYALKRQGGHTVLFHQAWNQPLYSKRNSRSIVLDYSGDAFASTVEGKWPVLQGSIKLYLARYIHLETNLWVNTQGNYLPAGWTMPSPPLSPTSIIHDLTQRSEQEELLGPAYPYRHAIVQRQKRRMRSKELHYIDHPVLSAIIQLTPLSLDEDEEDAEQEQEQEGN